MGILNGAGMLRMNGKKELTKSLEVNILNEPEKVYIPLAIGASTDFEIHVEEGAHVGVGTKLATRKDMYVPLYASVSGTFVGVEKRMHPTGRPQNHLVILNDFKKSNACTLPQLDPEQLNKEATIDAIKELGMLGLGGSGFPTFFKYQCAKDIDAVIINGVECEPYITSDYQLMMQETEALIDGSLILMKAASASKVIIAVKKGNPVLIEKLKAQALNHEAVEIKEVPDAYPLGWERVLIRHLMKKEYERFPGEVGVVVNNATTAIYVSKGIREGKPVTHRIITMSGEGLKHPQNVYVPVGTPVDFIVNAIEGYADIEAGIVIAGGPMMGKSVMNDQIVINEYANAMTVLPKIELEALPCLRCGLCTEYCPSKIQPVQIMNAEKSADIKRLEKLETLRCIECGLCSFVCPSKIEVSDWVSKAKRRLALAKK